jgi:hypothetical protein
MPVMVLTSMSSLDIFTLHPGVRLSATVEPRRKKWPREIGQLATGYGDASACLS